MREVKKQVVSFNPPRASRPSLVSLEVWGSAHKVDPECGITDDFAGGKDADLLDWILSHGTVFSTNVSLYRWFRCILPELVNWSAGYPDFVERDGMMQWGNYRVKLSKNGNMLTVRKGNCWGKLIDTGDLNPEDWSAVIDGFRSIGVHSLPWPTSRGSIAAALLHSYVPLTPQELDPGLLALAWQCCKGSRMEALILGSVGHAYAVDISSAFPAAAYDLLMCDHPDACEWIESLQYQPDAFYACALIDVTLPDWIAGPLAVRCEPEDQDGMELCFPSGRVTSVAVAKDDMELLKSLGIPFKIRKGYWGFIKEAIYPFRTLMSKLWDLRAYDKDFSKAISVAAVGQMLSVAPEKQEFWSSKRSKLAARPFCHPVYASHIYAKVRRRVYEKSLEVGLENTVAYTIDGLISYKAPKVDAEHFLGAWRSEAAGEFFLSDSYFKDRPDSDEPDRYRDAVITTPDDVPQDRYQIDWDMYVRLASLSGDKSLSGKIGEMVPITVTLPLGGHHRAMAEQGLTRDDYLERELLTCTLQV